MTIRDKDNEFIQKNGNVLMRKTDEHRQTGVNGLLMRIFEWAIINKF